MPSFFKINAIKVTFKYDLNPFLTTPCRQNKPTQVHQIKLTLITWFVKYTIEYLSQIDYI